MRTAIRDKELLVAVSPRAFAAYVWASGWTKPNLLAEPANDFETHCDSV